MITVAGIIRPTSDSQIICIFSLGVTTMSQRNAATDRTARTSMGAFYAHCQPTRSQILDAMSALDSR